MVSRKKWSTVAAPFNFPSSFTNMSFTLKQCYNKMLYDFEQVYFHQATGSRRSPPPSMLFEFACSALAFSFLCIELSAQVQSILVAALSCRQIWTHDLPLYWEATCIHFMAPDVTATLSVVIYQELLQYAS